MVCMEARGPVISSAMVFLQAGLEKRAGEFCPIEAAVIPPLFGIALCGSPGEKCAGASEHPPAGYLSKF